MTGIPHVSISELLNSMIVNPNRVDEMNHLHYVCSYSSLDKSEMASIFIPTNKYYSVTDRALNKNDHIFIVKPIKDNIEHTGFLLNKEEKLNKTI